MSKSLVLKIFWGGLGDHLLYTPIPRMAKETFGYDEVWISKYSQYRNPETKHLVWELNPYINGFTDEDADYPKFSSVPARFNILDWIAHFYKLPDDGNHFKDPEIYYTPKLIPSMQDVVLFEPNSLNKSGVPSVDETLTYFDCVGVKITHQMKPLYDNTPIDNVEVIEANNLLHFCDILYSCKQVFCYTTGAATLMSAIGKSATVLYTPGIKPMFHHSLLNYYINIKEVRYAKHFLSI